MRHALRIRLTLAVVPLLASACASGPPPAPEPLPFHVALVPLESIEMREASDSRKGAATEMLIETDPALFSELLVTSLEQDAGFARASLLEWDPAVPEDALKEEKDRMWFRQAREVGADLILVCEMSLSPIVYQNRNSLFLVNIPVWFMVGPVSWLMRDRTYHIDADLTASFYSPELLESEPNSESESDFVVLTDRMARVAAVTTHFGELDKNFISRAQGRLSRYALTIIVPPGFVARQSDALAVSLTAVTEGALCQGVATLVQSRARDIVHGDYLAPFYLVPADLSLEPGAAGTTRPPWSAVLAPRNLARAVGGPATPSRPA